MNKAEELIIDHRGHTYYLNKVGCVWFHTQMWIIVEWIYSEQLWHYVDSFKIASWASSDRIKRKALKVLKKGIKYED